MDWRKNFVDETNANAHIDHSVVARFHAARNSIQIDGIGRAGPVRMSKEISSRSTLPSGWVTEPESLKHRGALAALWRRLDGSAPWPGSSRARQYAAALSTFGAVSLLNLWLQRWIGYQTIALVYLLAVVVLALSVSRGPIILGTVLSAAGWRFLFAPPRYSFRIADSYDEMMFATYFVVSLTVGQLTSRLRAQRLSDREREERASALYRLTRELAHGTDRQDILGKALRQVAGVLQSDVVLLTPDTLQGGRLFPCAASTWMPEADEQEIAAWVMEHNQPAGWGTADFSHARGYYVPLSAGDRPAGVMGLRIKSPVGITAPHAALFESFAREIALVLDRQRLRDAELTNKLLTESERLGRTLLNSVSHELRTPIAAVTSAASSLRASGTLSAEQQNLLGEIETASLRLNQLVQSLLSAARLQAGQVRPRLDWCDVHDLARVALRHALELASSHPVEMRIDPEVPLLKADFTLMDQVLVNLITNAATHTPPGTPIEIRGRVQGSDVVLEVADRGPGLPDGQVERLFESFYRAPTAQPGGTGLGLAIVKGFVEAQGGRVAAANRTGGGAVFAVYLPIPKAPPLPEENA
jgi:two-component system sensor histidine kinase KdpD